MSIPCGKYFKEEDSLEKKKGNLHKKAQIALSLLPNSWRLINERYQTKAQLDSVFVE